MNAAVSAANWNADQVVEFLDAAHAAHAEPVVIDALSVLAAEAVQAALIAASDPKLAWKAGLAAKAANKAAAKLAKAAGLAIAA